MIRELASERTKQALVATVRSRKAFFSDEGINGNEDNDCRQLSVTNNNDCGLITARTTIIGVVVEFDFWRKDSHSEGRTVVQIRISRYSDYYGELRYH